MESLFERVPCPVCGGERSSVVKPSRYPAEMTAATLAKMYSASSSHKLLDQVVRCGDCGMQYLNPRPRAELVLESYSDAEDAEFVAQNEHRIYSFEKALRRVLPAVGWQGGAGKRYLDVGCAGGASLVAAQKLGFEAYGVEPSHWMAAYGRRTYGLEVKDGILKEGTYPDESFDVVTMWDVLEHVPSPKETVGVIWKLLRRDGIFVVTYPDVESLAHKVLQDAWPFWLSVHFHYFEPGTMRRLLEDTGFAQVQTEPYWMRLQLEYVLKRASEYFSVFGLARRAVSAVGLGRARCTYQLGQTIVVARKKG